MGAFHKLSNTEILKSEFAKQLSNDAADSTKGGVVWVGCRGLCVLATSNDVHRLMTAHRLMTCVSAHSWCLYYSVVAPLEDQAASTMIWYVTQWHYPDTESINPYAILIVPSARLGSDKYQFLSHCFDSTGNLISDLPHARTALYRFGHRARSLPLWHITVQLCHFIVISWR